MKIIVSSKNFSKQIETAINYKTTIFDIIGSEDTIIFYGITKMVFRANAAVSYIQSNFSHKFDEGLWRRIMEFMEKLEEQPIVIEFEGDENNLEISLCEFVLKFKK